MHCKNKLADSTCTDQQPRELNPQHNYNNTYRSDFVGNDLTSVSTITAAKKVDQLKRLVD
jgi:hypothetical protein